MCNHQLPFLTVFFLHQKYTDKQQTRNDHRTTYICKQLSSKAVQLGYIKTMKSQLIGFLMNFWISFSLALYFHSGEREEKCIIEDVPSDTLVIGKYLSMLCDDLTYAIINITCNVTGKPVIHEYGKSMVIRKRAHQK